MEFLTNWISNIIIFILLATIMDMLLPNSEMRKYAKIVVGLLLITVLIAPVFKLLSTDFEALLTGSTPAEYVEKNKMETLVDRKKSEIQAAQNAYILEEMAVQLKKDGEEELINRFNYAISHIDISVNNPTNPEMPEDLSLISVILSDKDTQQGDGEIAVVKPVEINTKDRISVGTREEEDITSLLASIWEVEEEKIEVVFERRGL